jgi:Na+/H+ antiporter
LSTFFAVLILLLVVAAVGVVARKVTMPAPFLFIGAGLLVGGVFGVATPRFEPSLFFVLFLPPLLYSDAWLTNLREFRSALRPILLLAIGLVVFTTVVVGYFVHWLLPQVPLSVAFALGAIVSPTDAVAVSSITERLRLPLRIPTIIDGESLVNDATGLVAFKFALAATLSTAGAFSFGSAALEFGRVAAGGLVIGLAVGWVSSRVRVFVERLGESDSMLEVTLSLLTPFAAAIPAEHLHVSSVMAAVAAGLHNGWADPIRMSPETRKNAWSVWSIVLFLLNGLVFLLLGLELPRILGELQGQPWVSLALAAVAVSVLVMVLRLLWVFPGSYVPRLLFPGIRRRESAPSWRGVFIVGWAGLRGAVTLAAALSIPQVLADGTPFPARGLVIFLAASVIVATLLVQGLSLPWVICSLGLEGDGKIEKEAREARMELARVALDRLHAVEDGHHHGDEGHDDESVARVAIEYEERIEVLAAEGEGASRRGVQARRGHERGLREELIAAQRERAVAMYHQARINDEVFRALQADLDLEEARLRAL